MILDLTETTTTEINKKLDQLREKVGAKTLSRVLTLVIATDNDTLLEESIDAANAASHEHPSRVIAVTSGHTDATEPHLDAQLRVGGDSSAGEVVVLRLSGPLAEHRSSVVVPFLLPDIPVVAWWPCEAPAAPAQDPLGQLAIRRITDATNGKDPLAAIKSRLTGYTPGDTDLAWSRITYWRALLASAIDQPPHEPITSALVSGLETEPALDVLAGWLATRIDGPVRRGGRRPQSRTGPSQRDGHAQPTAGRRDRDVEPHGQARRACSVAAQGDPRVPGRRPATTGCGRDLRLGIGGHRSGGVR